MEIIIKLLYFYDTLKVAAAIDNIGGRTGAGGCKHVYLPGAK